MFLRPADGPITFPITPPEELTEATFHYTVMMPGFILEEGRIEDQGSRGVRRTRNAECRMQNDECGDNESEKISPFSTLHSAFSILRAVVHPSSLAPRSSPLFTYTYDAQTLHEDFPNLDLHDADGFAGADTITFSFFVSGTDGGGERRHFARQIVLQGEELQMPDQQPPPRRRPVGR